ncbi:MAG: TraB/GumN family protein [Pseudomonadota bacterium]
MRNFVAALAVLLGLSAHAHAQSGVALWQLETAAGGRATLMGTVHLLPDDDGWADKRIKTAVKTADLLVIEAITDDKNAETLKAFAMRNGFIAPGEPLLSDRLSKAQAQQLREAEQALNLPVGTTARMQPWFAAMNITLASVMQYGFAAEQGAEAWLKSRFEKAREPIGALEGPLAGLQAIASLSPDLQIEMLRAATQEALSGGSSIQELYAAWRGGDQAELTSLLMDSEQFHPGVYEAVLIERNKAWVAPILDYLETPEREFIAVGAAHMVGPSDLISLLRSAGVQVTRLQ